MLSDFRASHVLMVAAALLLSASADLAAAAAADPAKDQELFTKAWPIIETSCVGCHGPDKQKGKLRLDTRDAWMAGGRDGKVVTVGKPESSLLIECIKYQAKKEDQNMPPKRKDQLSADQVAAISAWIAGGLPWAEPKAAKKKK
ncbi:MAG: c-type cytochrome [Planctomycetes bacterium]|nr:c-type cytochrome [Planctomycetota bacterium]